MKFTLTFHTTDGSPETRIEFPCFDDATRALFDEYLDYSSQVSRTRFAQEWPTYKVAFRLQDVSCVTHEGMLPDDDTLSALLHRMRPLILKDERTEYTKVLSALAHHINHPQFFAVAKEWKREYSGRSLATMITMKQDNLTLIGESFLRLYLNAYEYHRDKDKQTALEPFAHSFDANARKGLVTLLLMHKLSAINRLKGRLHEFTALREKETICEQGAAPYAPQGRAGER